MFRKSLIPAATVATMIIAVPAFAAPIPTTDAGQGHITFSGSVIEAPCSVSPDSTNINVVLPQVSTDTLKSAGGSSSSVPFSINLTGCSFEKPTNTGDPVKYSKVAVMFPDAQAPATADGTLANGQMKNMALTNPADKVAIQLLKSDASTPVDLSQNNPTTGDIQLDTSSSDNKLSFYARIISVAGGATVGKVDATVTYKLKYF